MSFARKTGVATATALLPAMLFAWGLIFSAYQMFATPGHLKQSLEASGIYETFVSDILDQAKQNQPQSEEKIPTDQTEVRQAVENAASPEYLKTQTEGFLDSIYSWARGESEHLQWRVDLSPIKISVGDRLTGLAQDRLAALPACSGPADTTSFDPFTAQCLPRGLDTNAVVADIRAQVDKQFEDPVFTQDDVGRGQGASLESQLSAVPGVYRKLAPGLWIGAALISLCAAALIFLGTSRRAGLKRVGVIFVAVGGVSLVIALLGAYVIKQVVKNLGGTGEIQTSALGVVSLLADGLRNWWLIFAAVVLALGAAATIVPIVAGRKNKPSSEPSREAPANPPEIKKTP